MAGKPISRYYNFGVTFRWVQGESRIAVKRGYVCEGHSFFVLKRPPFEITDLPGVDPQHDRHTWLAAIPAHPVEWGNDRYFLRTAHAWASNNVTLIDPNNRTDSAGKNRHGTRPRVPGG
ncbi:hypothetical protein QFW96_04860 [Saccharopolyspora sp. TS4A08]|uniref:Uncharacterized protein n=1 Tax=Saccharopolyspora ipomoeae TaxID=3042027 RepID=A0ABT6PIY9_9PSEU|nr:hypothetical protein [Saccharopolyspora sp. TS4A08]MDI2027924.1 hypothetical protein [Saccharopolyspora sp. TS4A08]